ncbi:transposase [Kitasatospora sp. NPDC089509]|uniref:transposase n=1 Tax=Kitasatospora sp. NPDC089509 TaxID=3364079 RepID=UPI0038096BE3
MKLRDGQVADRLIYVAPAVTVEGTWDILRLWAADDGEGATYSLHVLTEVRIRGVEDVRMVVCEGLRGLPDAIGGVWPTVTQNCIVPPIRASFRYAARQAWDKISKARKPVYSALTRTPPWSGSRSSPRPGAGGTPRSCGSGKRLGRVRALPQLRHRGPPGHLHHERDQVRQRPYP